MKIIHIFWGLSYGGIETMLVNIANEQYKAGNDIYIVIINNIYDSSLIENFAERIHLISLNRKEHSKSPLFLFKLNYHLLKIKPDIIHLHDTYLYNILLPTFRNKVCCTLHALPSGEIRYGTKTRYSLAFNLNELTHRISGNVQSIDLIPKVYSISNAVHDELFEKYGVESTVIYNGIVTSKFIQKQQIGNLRPLKIIQVSRLDYQNKGQDLLIEAVSKLINKGLEIELTLIGEGKSINYLKQLASDKGIKNNVFFMGKKNQTYIAEHLCEYDLFVQPSRYEGFGLTVAEAMAAKVPVLVSEGQGPAELTRGNIYGWIFENGNIEDLSSKIIYVIDHYKEAFDKAINGRIYVLNTFDVKVTAKEYLVNYSII